MKLLINQYYRLIFETKSNFKRYLYNEIDWSDRLIIIKGAKGVGKTTLMLQRIKDAFANDLNKALYVALDHIWFASHSLLELAEYHYSHGGTHLFLDEVHKYRNWDQELKNIYDYYPNLHVVATGSSMLRIDSSIRTDLSRRHVAYNLDGLSLREYLILVGQEDLGVITLDEIKTNHGPIAASLSTRIKVLPYFEKYLKKGFYPFFRDTSSTYYLKLQQSIINVIESDMPAVSNLEYDSVYRLKQLLSILSQQTPYTLNITELCRLLQVSRNTLVKLIDLLDRAEIMRSLFSTDGMKQLVKPTKLLFNNTNIMHALDNNADEGTLRETFVASQLAHNHKLIMPDKGDLLVDGDTLLEVGGKKKGFKQIKDIKNSYIVAYNIEIGSGNKIPMWMFGLLY